jgi:hypothetical protein
LSPSVNGPIAGLRPYVILERTLEALQPVLEFILLMFQFEGIDQAAPQGVWILSPEGKPLGRIELPEHDANFAWGDDDARGLYLTASTGLYRVRVGVPGIRPPLGVQSASR